jgi:RHS repeat-associated protein
MNWIFFLFPFFLFLPCQATEEYTYDEVPIFCKKADKETGEHAPLANLEGEPSSFVHGCVNVITGSYCEFHTDLVVHHGVEPLVLERSFAGNTKNGGALGGGWQHNHQSGIMFKTATRKSDKLQFEHCFFSDEHGGMPYTFEYHYIPGKGDIYRLLNSLKGVTNNSQGYLSAQTNLKNLKCIKEAAEKVNITTGSNRIREYNRLENRKSNFLHLIKDIKPGGNQFKYSYDYYDHKNRLDKITLTDQFSSHGWLHFTHHTEKDIKKKNPFKITTNDGRWVSYDLQIRNKLHLLMGVERSDGPKISYAYNTYYLDNITQCVNICKKSLPDDRFLEIEYYKFGHNPVIYEDVNLLDEFDPRIKRVKFLFAPAGTDKRRIPIYQFIYDLFIVTDKQKPELRDVKHGSCMVYNALGYKIQYAFNAENRLTLINKFDSNGLPYAQENLFWGGGENDKTQLIGRSFSQNGVNIFAHNYLYDDDGNVLIDGLYGNLTGNNTIPLILSPHGSFINNGCEVYHKTQTYSKDGFNLVLSEEDGFQRTVYEYVPNTNRVSAKFEGNSSKWFRRTFYQYDWCGGVCQEIKDDGSQLDPNDLTDVTERRITYYSNSHIYPAAYPLIIEEKCLDLATGKEQLIHKVVNQYNDQAKIKQQDHYDSQGTHVYSLFWDFDNMGNIKKETNAIGQSTIRRFDDNGNCSFEQLAGKDYHKIFTYDFMNRLIKEEENHPDGINHITIHRYDYTGNKISTLDHNGNETFFFHDAFGRVIQTIYPPVLNEDKVPCFPSIKKEYNPISKVTKETNALGMETLMSYNIRGQLTEIIYPDGTTEKNSYYLNGALETSKAKNNTVTKYSYDCFGRPTKTEIVDENGELLSKTTMTYNGFHLIHETDPAGNVTSYTYYPDGKTRSKRKGNYLITYSYDGLGRENKTTEQYGPNAEDVIVKTKEHDFLNRITEEAVFDANNTLISKINYVYDHAGNVEQIINYTQKGSNITQNTYNSHGVLALITDAKENKTVTTHRYDYRNELGKIVPYQEITDPEGNISIAISDALGRTTTKIRKDPFGKVTQRQDLAYDVKGNLRTIRDTVISAEKTDEEIITIMHYDTCDRLKDCYEAYGTLEQKQTTIIYNSFGQKEKLIKNDGNILSHTYDALGRLKSHQSSDGKINYSYEYDLNSNPIRVEDHINGTATVRKYDGNDFMYYEELGNNLIMRYSYDYIGRINEIILPDNTKIAYEYKGSQLKAINRLDSTDNVDYTHQYDSYDHSGNLTKSILVKNAGTLNFDYDILGRLTNAETSCWNEQIKTYDKVGNILEILLYDSFGEASTVYTYDNLYQITSETGAATHAYSYDSHYNRRTKNGKVHHLNPLHQLIDDGISIYSYDRNGNIKKKESEEHTSEYTYDALDRLITFIHDDQKITYCYDENNRRLSKTFYSLENKNHWKEQKTVRYLYQGQNEIGAVNKEGKIDELRILGLGKGAEIGATVALEINQKVYVPIHDHIGNVACLLDSATGTVVETYRYSSFGEELFDGLTSINPWRFSSKRIDTESGLVYFGRRYYSPEIGRWTTLDPIGREGGPNLYAYVLNNALTHFDLYGLYGMSDRWQSAFSNLFNHIANLFSFVAKIPGHIISAIGKHILPIPYVNHLVEFGGHCLRGENPASYDWSQHRSQLLVHRGTNHTNSNHLFVSTNGIGCDRDEHLKRLGEISAAYGGVTVYGLHTAYNGVILDVLESACQKLGIPTNGQVTAKQEIRKLLNQQGDHKANTTIYTDAHSRGAETIYHFDRHIREKMNVSAFAPARIANDSHYDDANYYVCPTDVVPLFSPVGYYKGVKNGNVHFLPTNGNPVSDHLYDNKQFQEVRSENGEVYQQQFGKAA